MKTNVFLMSFILVQLLYNLLTTNVNRENREAKTSKCVVENNGYTGIFLDKEEPGEPIDLGLSVLWADHNVGATFPEGYGGYYAWGEVEEKDFYDWPTYLHCDGTRKTCHDIGKEISGTEYDVAHVKWGGDWRMPTREEVKELCTKCNYVWTKVNGVQGVRFHGPNGNSVFLPNSGYRKEKDLYDRGLYGCYWTGTQRPRNNGGYACNLAFIERYKGWSGNIRCYGRPIRPVMNKPK